MWPRRLGGACHPAATVRRTFALADAKSRLVVSPGTRICPGDYACDALRRDDGVLNGVCEQAVLSPSVALQVPDDKLTEPMADSTLPRASVEEFERLTLPHLNAVARFALSLTRDRADADDLVQETYFRAYRSWKTYRPEHDARPWLFTICRHAFLRTLRLANRMVESEDGDLDALPAVRSHVQAVRLGLGDLFELVDVRPAIERAINNLPEPHHSVLVLVDLEEHTYEEAAAVLGLPIGTVRSRLFRARRIIQEALIAYAQDAGHVHKRQQRAPVDPVSS